MRNVPATSLLALAVALHLATAPAVAQDAPAPAPAEAPAGDTASDAPVDENEILVTAENLRGTVDTPSPPVLELNEADIAAYGAGSIAELIQALAPATGGGA